MRRIRKIVIHCSASRNCDPSVTRDVIDRWHRERGWRMVGYHYVIEVDGQMQIGRPETRVGAHVSGHNEDSIGICMVGTDSFTEDQWATLKILVSELMERYPQADVYGHRDLSPDKDGDGKIEKWEWLKICPGFEVLDWLEGDMEPLEGHTCESLKKAS